ncbi:MAG TPA: aryl-sulfate sulfotransferase [Steroidobacteraceae bacterium]|jgi:hypothetical protein|nr:aryl-sulfate sulfotransferase [Steroidobacteraceae bacterium]
MSTMSTMSTSYSTMVSTAGIASGICCTALMSAASASPSVYPVGVTRYDPATAYNSDVLFSGADNRTYLIDMDGHVLHRWDVNGFPGRVLDPALVGGVKGEIGAQLSTVPAGGSAGGVGEVPGRAANFRDETFGYQDWSGRTLWQWGRQAPGGAALQHHDWELLPNGDTLLLGNKIGSLPGFGARAMMDDVIYEVNKAGQIVWTWAAAAHLAQFGFTASQLDLLKRVAAVDYLHMNAMQELGPNHWAEAGDERFSPDNIMISSRNANFIAIISRRTGNIVWRLGPNFAPIKEPYANSPASKAPFALDRFSGQHDAHMIPEGLPGAGNILMFDDEGEGGYPPATLPVIAGSRILEIDPVRSEVVWKYANPMVFYSSFLSSAERLPNGNTLIDEGMDGRFFQVTGKGEIVWEYISPFRSSSVGVPVSNSVYRIQAVPYAWVPLPGPHAEQPVIPSVFGRIGTAR